MACLSWSNLRAFHSATLSHLWAEYRTSFFSRRTGSALCGGYALWCAMCCPSDASSCPRSISPKSSQRSYQGWIPSCSSAHAPTPELLSLWRNHAFVSVCVLHGCWCSGRSHATCCRPYRLTSYHFLSLSSAEPP